MIRAKLSLAAAMAALILWPGTARSQYNITTLLLDGGTIPKTNSTWSVNVGNDPTMPLSTDGVRLAFVQCASGSNQSCGPTASEDGIWVEDLSTKAFTHLVQPGDPVPGPGGLTFTTFGPYALLASGWVVFLAPDGPANGFYSVSLSSREIRVVANQNTNLGGLGTGAQFSFGDITEFLPQSDGSLVVFEAGAAEGASAIYSAEPDGNNLIELAGPNTPVGTPDVCGGPINQFYEPRGLGSNITFLGSDSGDFFLFVTPLTGIPLDFTCQPSGYIAYSPTVSYNTTLPDAGVFLDYVSLMTLDSQHVYFTGAGNGSAGVYQANLNGDPPITTIFGANQSLPGMMPPYQSVGGSLGLAANNGTLIFNLAGFSGPGAEAGGLYAYNDGNIVRIAGTGDILNSDPGNSWSPPLAPNSVATNGMVVFSFGNPNQRGVFLATPTPCATDVTAELEVSQTPPHLNAGTGDYNSKVTVKNTSGAAIPAPVSAVFNGLVNAVTNYGTQAPELLNKGAGATTCLSPLGEAYLTVNGGTALAAGAETTVELNIVNAAGTPSFTTLVVSGTPR